MRVEASNPRATRAPRVPRRFAPREGPSSSRLIQLILATRARASWRRPAPPRRPPGPIRLLISRPTMPTRAHPYSSNSTPPA